MFSAMTAPEIQPGQSVHGLVAVQDALHGGQGGVGGGRGAVACCCRVEQTARKQQQDQGQQGGAEDFAQPLGQLLRVLGHQKGHCKKQEGVAPLQRGAFPASGSSIANEVLAVRGMARHGPMERYTRMEKTCANRGAPARPAGAAPGPGYGHHACNGQADGTDGKPGKGQPEAGACLCPQIGRKDQVACSEKHGKEGEPDQQLFLPRRVLVCMKHRPFYRGKVPWCGFLISSLVYNSAHVKKRKK